AYRCHATPGNYNNHIGVPLTLLATPSDTDFLVVEMGANHLQETDFLCKLAEPTYGLVTNNGLDHLEGFGSPENVARANAELYEFLKATGGVAFVNMADASLVKYSEGVQRVAYNVPNSMAWDNGVQEGLQAAFLVGGREKWIKLNMFGRHNVLNALAALCVGRYFGVPENDIYQALESYQPTGHRSAILSYGGAIVVSDCYNANPSSMEVALEEFLRVAPAPRTVILGDMWELGSYSAEHHLRIIHRILNAENLQAILCGPLFTQAAREVSANLLCFESVQSLKNWFSGQNWQGHHILLKGSRGMSLEKLLE
ncbi:MAG: Mur ligase family protein, partial [Flavobacteriales bacterium]|nr:Mur ligase family protein [Flavobacteriales bacterium]MDW8410807.1 Mur ligase family protein [Flavobacteriales bacterium]